MLYQDLLSRRNRCVPPAFVITTWTAAAEHGRMRALWAVITVITAQIAPRLPLAEGKDPSFRAPHHLAEFDIADAGDLILVPVTLGSNEFKAVVDTGFSCTVLDSSLHRPVGATRSIRVVRTPGGPVRLPFIPVPSDLRINGLSFGKNSELGLLDLDHIRRAAGYPIYGILGMDFLKRFVVQIDEDRGKLRFFDALPAAEGQRASIRYSGGTPQVRVLLDGAHEEILVLDTGYYSPASAAVTRPTFDKLVNMGRFDVEHSSLHVANAAGHANADRRIAVGTLSVGNTTIRDVQLIEAGADVLGLTFFARFKTTFDFPNDSLYLAPGRRFREPDLPDRSGLHIWRVDSSVAVRSVDERSPASVAEIKAGDIIVNVSGADAANMSLHQLRVLLRRGGDVVSITTARNGRRKSVHLALADSNGGMHKKDEQTGGKRRAQ